MGDEPESDDALVSLDEGIHNRPGLRGCRSEVAARILRRAPPVVMLGLGLKLRPRLLARGYPLEKLVEPTPMPDSRLTLTTERDSLGMRRVKVEWRVGELEKPTIRKGSGAFNGGAAVSANTAGAALRRLLSATRA